MSGLQLNLHWIFDHYFFVMQIFEKKASLVI